MRTATRLRPHAAEREAAEAPVVPAAARGAARIRTRRLPAAIGGIRVAGTHGIVTCTLLLVGEHRIGLGNLFELLLGVRRLVDIGVELARLLLERLLDLSFVRVLGDPKDRVVVFFVHACHVAETLSVGARRYNVRTCTQNTASWCNGKEVWNSRGAAVPRCAG